MLGERVKHYLSVMAKTGVFPNTGNLVFHTGTLFKDIDLKNKTVLDIGGGSGLFSFYAASRGAKEVICLEPELEGSTEGVNGKFQHVKSMLNFKNVFLQQITFQSFNSNRESFDIILLYNSINHLDETACINLLQDEQATTRYKNIFKKIASLSHPGTKLIICDCSNKNIFAKLGVRNPFEPSIGWHKHQAPEVWARMLGQVGFANPRISWSSFNRFRLLGRVLFGNKVMAYFLMSHFCLKMEKA